LEELAHVCRRYHFIVHAYCQMSNHFHVLIETPEGNLGQGMRQLNSAYSQCHNRRHHLAGHLLQGRYHAILVQRENYLCELARYIVLNPVRAGLVASPEAWTWSSYCETTGEAPRPSWLDTGFLLGLFKASPLGAVCAYRQFVMEGIGRTSPLKHLSHQCILGDPLFIQLHREQSVRVQLNEVARVQRRAVALSLDDYAARYVERDAAMACAYRSTVYSMMQIAAHFGVSVKTVSRAVAAFEQAGQSGNG
jgi:REP element-mobilizing transposase RayT